MTREEAIYELSNIFAFGFYNDRVDEAIDVAIEALEREQQRQEDIYECRHCLGEVHKNYIYCPFCGERIEALEQEKTSQNLTKPNKSDLISRQAAIDAVMGFMPSLTTPDGCGQFDREIFEAQEMFVDIGQALNKLPTAQPFTEEQIQTMQELESAQVEKAFELGKADRPTGHWIENDNGTFSCSNCQSWIPEEQHHYARHCLYCGVRMEVEKKNEHKFNGGESECV